MPKLTLDYKDYNIMKVTRIILLVLFIILLPIVSFYLFEIIVRLTNFYAPFPTMDKLFQGISLLALLLLCLSILFFQKHRLFCISLSFFLIAVYEFYSLIGETIISKIQSGNIVVWFLIASCVIFLLIAALFIIRAVRGKLPRRFRILGPAYAVAYILFFILANIPHFQAHSIEYLPSAILLFLVVFPHFLFAWIYYMSFNDTFFDLFLRQNFKSVLQNNTILFS
ncbi:MAG: hypothetical protein VB082_02955 [Christensenella sp.]|nr:hypothetical protein [Christensenella sp.]